MGLLAKTVFKGVKNVEFSYGGPRLEMGEMLHRLGLLSQEKIALGKDCAMSPQEFVLRVIPKPPASAEEIKAVIGHGITGCRGALCVRLLGTNGAGQRLQIDRYMDSPGLEEAFQMSGLAHDAYLFGRCAAVFAMMVAEGLCHESGLMVPEQLGTTCRKYIVEKLAKMCITADETITILDSDAPLSCNSCC